MYDEVRHTSRTSGRYQGAPGAWRKASCLLPGVTLGRHRELGVGCGRWRRRGPYVLFGMI